MGQLRLGKSKHAAMLGCPQGLNRYKSAKKQRSMKGYERNNSKEELMAYWIYSLALHGAPRKVFKGLLHAVQPGDDDRGWTSHRQ